MYRQVEQTSSKCKVLMGNRENKSREKHVILLIVVHDGIDNLLTGFQLEKILIY